ncbi:MAG: TetR/AcrR family transcriptional regulator [Bacteroidales bacterium]|nr:TetR/AcrR family transcriptional regulator [Bacteroidales bacterium]
MQTLKTDIRKRILKVSKKLFLKKGFRETTTRDIARESGVNLSNLYHYFASKDELFRELLKPATDTLEAMLDEHHGNKGEDILRLQEEGYVEATLEEYLDAIRKYRNLLKLLLFKSQGSSLEGYKEYYVEKATRLVLDWLKAMKTKHPEINTDVSDFFVHLNNVWMFTLLEEILMHDLPEEEVRSVMSDYIQFEVIGWRKMIRI